MDRSPKTPLALLLIAALTLTATFLLTLTGPGSLTEVSVPPPTVSASSQNQTGPWYTIYFTDRTLDGFSGGPDEPLVEAIEAAQLSVDVAAYDLSLWSVRDALLHAQERGLSVRVVMDADNADREEVQQLIDAGIPVVVDTSEDGWMHDKFVILDRQGVWTGSMNFTLNDGYRNDNNLIWLGSPEVAEAYRAEFEEMFVDGLFGAESPREVGGRSFTVSGTNLEVWFSPDDGVSARIVELINSAEVSIHFLASSFAADEVGDAIRARAAAGVVGQGVFDEGQLENPGGEVARMLTEGLDVRLDANPDKLHHKVIVIDGRVVITGSYNFSMSAEERNDENVVVICSEAVAEGYLAEVERVRGEVVRGGWAGGEGVGGGGGGGCWWGGGGVGWGGGEVGGGGGEGVGCGGGERWGVRMIERGQGGGNVICGCRGDSANRVDRLGAVSMLANAPLRRCARIRDATRPCVPTAEAEGYSAAAGIRT